jgi:hypothetical protein
MAQQQFWLKQVELRHVVGHQPRPTWSDPVRTTGSSNAHLVDPWSNMTHLVIR